MPPRHPSLPSHAIPQVWLFTDERMTGDPLAAARTLPPRSGIIFRHYRTPAPARIRLARKLRRIAKARGHVFLVAGHAADARRIGADGWHARSTPWLCGSDKPVSTGAHNERELARAIRAGTCILFLSPVFATSSHPGAAVLGKRGFARLAHRLMNHGTAFAIALGGMDAARFRPLRYHGAQGWAAIDALSGANPKA